MGTSRHARTRLTGESTPHFSASLCSSIVVSRTDNRLFKPLRETWRDENEPIFDLEELKIALPLAERARIGSNLRLLNDLHVHLHKTGLLPFNVMNEGISPLTLFITRKAMFDVPSLSQAVEAAKRLKAQADA